MFMLDVRYCYDSKLDNLEQGVCLWSPIFSENEFSDNIDLFSEFYQMEKMNQKVSPSA